ncbi:MAG: Do family serine endopeptidase [Chitinivibrionales bacterium]|nr:Do family serine endopeptidase [Chitinivibrionales bacterium]
MMYSFGKAPSRLLPAAAVGAFVCLTASFVVAQEQDTARPERGSVEFGAEGLPVEWDEQDIAPFRDVYVRIAEAVIPSVVSIIPTRIDTVLFFRNPFYRFFGENFPDFFFGPEDGPPVERRERRVQGLGSGVIVSEQGYILTNYHVVQGARDIEVRLANDRVFQARIVGTDSLSDVAVIKIQGEIPDDLPVAYLGDSDTIRAGDWVAAVGNPFSLTSTVTSGIISALGREIGDMTLYQNFIQTDAAINPGNSGGPLVDIRGAVIGINTLIFSQTGGFMGIGFAIPINMARRVMADLIYEGRVVRGWIGVTIQELTPEARRALGIEARQGALVADVVAGQPAARAGVEAGDVIVAIADQEITDVNALRNIVASLRPGEQVPVTIVRDGERRQLTIEIAERTREAVEETQRREQAPRPERGSVRNALGIGVEPLTSSLRRQLNLPRGVTGVVVREISPKITDARAKLRPGDVITRATAEGMDWMNIESERDFEQFVDRLEPEMSVLLQVRRGDTTFFLPFDVPRREQQ